MSVLRNLREEATGALALLVLGAGFLAMAFPALSPVPFWIVWILGFAVVLPLVAIALGETAEPADSLRAGDFDPFAERHERDQAGDSTDPLTELRRRYAEGEIDEFEFERRVERLLETEDEGAAAEYVERRRTAREDDRREPSRAGDEAPSGERHASRERSDDSETREESELGGESA